MQHVRIQSEVTIYVSSGLQHEDLTKVKSDVANRLKVKPTWEQVLIKKGAGIYPAKVVEWPTVKALQKDGLIMVGEITDDEPEAEPKAKVEKPKQVSKSGVKVVQSLNLEEIAE